MTPSPFAVTGAILAENTNSFDLLRIIAKDESRLGKEDREALRTAADELEAAQRSLILATNELIETRNRLIAVNDQMIAMRKASLPTGVQRWSMSTGWIKMEHIK